MCWPEKPRLHLIIPTYHRAREPRRCLQSFESQPHQSFKLLACDEGSADNMERVAEDFRGRLRLIYSKGQVSDEQSDRTIKGLRLAQGPNVGLLDSDDQWRSINRNYRWRS